MFMLPEAHSRLGFDQSLPIQIVDGACHKFSNLMGAARDGNRDGHWGGGMGPAPAPSAPSLAVRPSTILGLLGRKILPEPNALVKSWRFFHLENEVYLVKIAFASENLKKFSCPVGYLLYSIFDFVPQK